MEQVIFILKIAVKRRPGNQRGAADVGQCELFKGQGGKLGKESTLQKRVGAAAVILVFRGVDCAMITSVIR